MTLPWSWAEERLAGAHNYWLATAGGGGRPYLRPVWCVWHDGGLVLTASPASRKIRNALANPAVSVALELVREVVVVDGMLAEVDAATDAVAAYEAKYAWRRPAAQRWYRVSPSRVYASEEATYPESATRFTL
jgi:nitroimidazol reductase NimA-like FMN-containing flavoprotein (pyridoxamine 5'-phosphate oxidase superfamily)